MGSPKAYIAAPIFTAEQLAVVDTIKLLLDHEGYNYFSPYDASRAIWRGRAPEDCTPEERARVLDGNVVNLNRPTRLLIAWVGGTPDGKVDTGVAWELGYFHHRERVMDYYSHNDIASLAYIYKNDVRQNMNLMLAGTVTGVVKGDRELHAALRAFKLGGARLLGDQFNPDRHIAQEKEPIV